MANPTVRIAFSYTTDPLVLASLGGFNVYAVDASKNRLTPSLAVPPTALPTITFPLVVSIPGYAAQMIEVVPFDKQGKESTSAYASVYVPLPAATAIAQVTS